MNTPQNSNKKFQFYPKRMLMSRAETEVTKTTPKSNNTFELITSQSKHCSQCLRAS